MILDLDDDKTRANIDKIIWNGKVAEPNLNRRGAAPEEIAQAVDAFRALYLLVEFQRQNADDDRSRAISYIESRAAEMNLGKLSFVMDEFARKIGHMYLMGEDPLGGGLPAGRKEAPLTVRIEISAAVQRHRDTGMTLEQACAEVSASWVPYRSPDAIRRIYENCMANKATAAMVRLFIAGRYEF
jgi:hypothetical protein